MTTMILTGAIYLIGLIIAVQLMGEFDKKKERVTIKVKANMKK
jgi:hypothetical protein